MGFEIEQAGDGLDDPTDAERLDGATPIAESAIVTDDTEGNTGERATVEVVVDGEVVAEPDAVSYDAEIERHRAPHLPPTYSYVVEIEAHAFSAANAVAEQLHLGDQVFDIEIVCGDVERTLEDCMIVDTGCYEDHEARTFHTYDALVADLSFEVSR